MAPVPPAAAAVPLDKHVPPIAKQPPERSMPFANVELAVVDVTSSAALRTPPPNVEVAVVVAVKNAPTISPTTESFAYGVEVPMPIFTEEDAVSTFIEPASKERTAPVPDWLIVSAACVDDVAIVDVEFARTNSCESRPSSVSATNAEGVVPKSLRGVISPSHEGVVDVAPIS